MTEWDAACEKLRKYCRDCEERPAKFVCRGRVKWDRDHTFVYGVIARWSTAVAGDGRLASAACGATCYERHDR